MEEKKKKFNKKTWLTSTLRRASYRWPPRNEAMKLARVDRGLYKCAHCEGTFKNGEIKIDHINPVVTLSTGFTTWDDFIDKLFCDTESFQILCSTCHDAKTLIEDEMRKYYKNLEKDKKDVDNKKKKD